MNFVLRSGIAQKSKGHKKWVAWGRALRADGSRSAAVRVLRAMRTTRSWPTMHRLLREPLYQAHLAFLKSSDLFSIAEFRAFLTTGLSTAQRVSLAEAHYRDQRQAYSEEYAALVYHSGGLTLWSAEIDEVTYSLKLQPGHDVVHEGGLSIVLFVGDGRVAAVSYSMVDGRVFGVTNAGPGKRIFVGRKQLSHEHDYQKRFNKAFDRAAPAHFCLAALTGVGRALGEHSFLAVRTERHPSFSEEYAAVLTKAYDHSWQEMGGVLTGDVYRVPLPIKMTPIEELKGSHRQRAVARRAHLDSIAESAEKALRPMVR